MRTYNIGELRKAIRESKNEFKPVLGKGVADTNKKVNDEAYKSVGKETKAYEGGLTNKGESALAKVNRGMSDLKFNPDSISTPFKDKVKSQLKGYVSAEAEKLHKNDPFGNAVFHDEKDIEKAAKENKKNDDKAKTDGLTSSKHKDEIEKNTESMFENKKISKIQFKHTQFLSEGHMLSKVPDDFKVEGKRFIMKDNANNEYLVEWADRKPNVTKKINKTQVNEEMQRIKDLWGYKSKDFFKGTNAQSRMNENKEFSNILNRTRELMK